VRAVVSKIVPIIVKDDEPLLKGVWSASPNVFVSKKGIEIGIETELQ